MAPPRTLWVGGQPGNQLSFSQCDSIPSRGGFGHTYCRLSFSTGEGRRHREGTSSHRLKGLVLAKHLNLNHQLISNLSSPYLTSLGDPTSILGGSQGYRMESSNTSRTVRYLKGRHQLNGQWQICWSDLFETFLKSFPEVLKAERRANLQFHYPLTLLSWKMPLWAPFYLPDNGQGTEDGKINMEPSLYSGSSRPVGDRKVNKCKLMSFIILFLHKAWINSLWWANQSEARRLSEGDI